MFARSCSVIFVLLVSQAAAAVTTLEDARNCDDSNVVCFEDARTARVHMEAVVAKYAKLMEDSFVTIAGEESAYCVVKGSDGDYVESCDPPNSAGVSKYDNVWTDSTTNHNPLYQNPDTGTCTRFDKNEQNEFLPTASIKTGRKSACSESEHCLWADDTDVRDSSTTNDCTTKSARWQPQWAQMTATQPNFNKCKCDYFPIVNANEIAREPRAKKPSEFARHKDFVSKADFLDNSKCTDDAETICAVNKDHYGINLPDGKSTTDIRVCGEIAATNKLQEYFEDNSEKYPDMKWNFMGMQVECWCCTLIAC
jgi:hypothetical protein